MSPAHPFFATAAGGEERRLLLIAYHFPPSEESGALRWQKLARFAAERGWGLDVVALDPNDLSCRDDARLLDLPSGVRLWGVPLPALALDRMVDGWWHRWRPRRVGIVGGHSGRGGNGGGSRSRLETLWGPVGARDLTRAYHAWREYARDGAWAGAAARVGLGVLRLGAQRAVISCGPPHMCHEAARVVAERGCLPLVLDLRDPWALVQRLPEAIASPVWYGLAARHERRVMRDAALVVMNTEPARRAMAARYPEMTDRLIAVPNGIDQDEVVPAPLPRQRFVVAYAGTIYLDRDPRPLFAAAARLVAEERLAPAEFGIEFMGDVAEYDGVALQRWACAAGIEAFLRVHPPAPRQAALQFLARASLLALLPQDSDLAIPAKLYDYLRCEAWVLALAERDSAVELLLRDTQADVVAPQDADGLFATLRRRFRQFRDGERPRRVADPARVGRATQAAKLFDAIEALTGTPQPRRGITPTPSPGRGRRCAAL